ncbi:MAG TPA: hypothetical protein VHN14_10155 [Kofleriaceae bacterium]|nr:hypothetical protein [Kofleriaceae bacterium]
MQLLGNLEPHALLAVRLEADSCHDLLEESRNRLEDMQCLVDSFSTSFSQRHLRRTVDIVGLRGVGRIWRDRNQLITVVAKVAEPGVGAGIQEAATVTIDPRS